MSDIDSRSLIDGTADEMHLDVRNLANDLRWIEESGDSVEVAEHFAAAKSFLSELGIPVKTIDEAADAIQEMANTGSPTLVLVGYEQEWGEDEWASIGIIEEITDPQRRSLLEAVIDFELLGKKLLEAENRTKASYGETQLWVLHN